MEEYTKKVVDIVIAELPHKSREVIYNYAFFFAPGCIAKGEKEEELAAWIIEDFKLIEENNLTLQLWPLL